jgi:hypothetical protein
MIGIGIGIVVETVKLARSMLPSPPISATSDWDENGQSIETNGGRDDRQ